jgi:hypothetical protein
MNTSVRASRWTRGNFLFPTVIEVTDQTLIRTKRDWWKVSETTMHLSRIASVHIEKGLCFADLRIESSGGGDDILSHGHWKRDAERVQALVQDWQGRNLSRGDPNAQPSKQA